MRRILFCFISLLLCIPFRAQNDDPVLMTVNGNEVKKSEFEYFFNKNRTEDEPVNRKTLKEYADLYLNFKLKVQAAMDEGVDKSESFLDEFKAYRNMQAEDYLLDNLFLEGSAKGIYDATKLSIGPDGLVDLSVISLRPDEKNGLTFDQCREVLEAVHDALDDGADFEDVARSFFENQAGASGGHIGLVTRNQIPEEIGNVLFDLKDGEYSTPILSGEGNAYFIVRANVHRDFGSYADNRDDIYEWMKSQGNYYPEARLRKANEYADKLGWPFRNDTAVAYLDSVLEDVNVEFGNISREFHDGLLMFDISNREVWEKASNDSLGKLAYFNSHRKLYKFEKPAFKGIVLFCQSEDVFHEVEELLKDVEMKDWIDSLVSFNREQIQVRVMKGSAESDIFLQGQNPYVDKVVFGKGDYESMPYFPYVNVLGRVINQPEGIEDVMSQVNEDYQNYLEKEWVDSLRKKYKHSINKKVLKQVSIDNK